MDRIRLSVGVPLDTWKWLRDKAEAAKVPGRKASVEGVVRAILTEAVSTKTVRTDERHTGTA